MASNFLLLKGVTQSLGLNNAALVNIVNSLCIECGGAAPEKIDDWLVGRAPIDREFLVRFRELVRVKARLSRRAALAWPRKGPITFAVCNSKGGVGTSTVAAALATVAALSHGLRTKHLYVGKSPDYFQRLMTRIGVNSKQLSCISLHSYEPTDEQIIVIDVHRTAASDVFFEKQKPSLSEFKPDILLVPADFGSSGEVDATRDFVGHFNDKTFVRLLHRPRYMNTCFSATAGAFGFDVTSEEFAPLFIPQSETSSILPIAIGCPWEDEEQHAHYLKLFEYLMYEVGVEPEEIDDEDAEISGLDFAGLLILAITAE